MRRRALAILTLLAAGWTTGNPACPDGQDCPSSTRTERHLIYQHGRIVQDQQNRRPVHAQHGPYELDAIAEAFRKRGFTVHAEMRPKDMTVDEGANAVVKQVRELIASGVAPDHITVVGASMGSSIIMRASARLNHPGVRFVALAPCFSLSSEAIFKEGGAWPSRNMLVIREESDVPSSECPKTDRAKELVLNTGLAHGFIYRPLPEWVEPVIEFAR